MNEQPKQQFQIKRLFALGADQSRAAGFDTAKEFLEEVAAQVTRGRTVRLSKLTFDEANDMITALGGVPFARFTRSKRTENYRKQQAGIKTIVTDAHLKKIGELANARGWSPETLEKFCTRQIKKPAPTTTEEGNKVVEGLKAMNKRDGLIAFPGPKSKAQSPKSEERVPKFRRVA